MTLSGRREPSFHSAGHRDEHPAGDAHAAHAVHALKAGSNFTRFISGFQAISTLIGVPLALASGYTLYRTNFAPDATCSNLRASIVSMLDKNVDPATRRALVKRDIEAFEAGCGAVDPDAHAAFKALLAADKGVAQVAPAAKPLPTPKPVAVAVAKETPKETPKEAKPEAKPEAVKQEAAKVELRPAIAEPKAESKVEPPKAVAAAPAIVPAEAAQPAEQMSDTRWLDAVRQALVDQPAETREAAPVAKTVRHEAVQPVLPNKPGEPVLQPNWNVAAPAVQSPAAPLPPPVAVNHLQAVPSNPNRPVPPADVPTAQYATNGANSSSWVAQIPFVGRMIDSAGN